MAYGYWNYRIARGNSAGSGLLLIEAYYDENDEIVGWCDASLQGDDLEDLLRQVRVAATRPTVDTDSLFASERPRGELDARRAVPGPAVDDGDGEARQLVRRIWHRPLSEEERRRAGPALAAFESFMVYIPTTGRFEPRWTQVEAMAVEAILADIIEGGDEEWLHLPPVHRHHAIAQLRDSVERDDERD